MPGAGLLFLPFRPALLLALVAASLAVRPAGAEPEEREAPVPLFQEVAAEVGLDFVHDNGMTGELYLPEVTGAGAALLDYDLDGDLDAYLVQGGPLGPESGETTPKPSDRLFRNDPGPDGSIRFVDVTTKAGIEATGYGMGVATGDVDGDDFPDLYLANLGSNQLWQSRGDGTFEETATPAGIDDSRWSVVPVFFDFDGDRDLDLYLGNYVSFTWARHRKCATVGGAPDYCGPLAYSPVGDRLFRNRGDGTFEDASTASGVGSVPGNTLGAVAVDLDDDGRLDLFVANDMMANFAWMNRGDGTFREDGLLTGLALNADGQAEASMGITIADFDQDLDEDLFLTHLTAETNTLYRNLGGGAFRDDTIPTGLGHPSFDRTGFGTGFLDADHDGDLDLVAVNGAVRTLEEQARAGDPYPLKQRDQLFLQDDGEFREQSARGGSGLVRPTVSRGLARGDVDLDGDADLLINDNAGPARLLLGRAAELGPAVEILPGGPAAPPALGATILAYRSRGSPVLRRVHTDGSYASARSPWVELAPGPGNALETLEIRWPAGARQRLREIPETGRLVVPEPETP